MADVRVDFKSDTTSVTSGIAKIKTGLGGLNSLAAGVGGVLKTGFVAIGAAAAAAGTAFVAGSKDIIDYGGDLDDLSVKTGIAVKDLVVLQEAFKFAGISADSVSKAVLGLNNKLANPTDKMVSVLNSLGLSFEEVDKLSMEQKFTTVAEAIGNLSSSSEKAAAASTLFGKNLGQGLLPLFANKNALKEAAISVGGLGASMEKYAPAFAKIGDAVDSITTKFRQFFAEALGQNADKLVALADKLLAIDLGGAGTGFGAILSDILGVMEGKSIKQAIIDGIAEATPILVSAFIEVADIIVAGVSKAMLGGEVTMQKTWDDVVFGFKSLQRTTGPMDFVPAMKRVAASAAEMDRLDASIAKIAADRVESDKRMGMIVLDPGDKVALLGFTESLLAASKEFSMQKTEKTTTSTSSLFWKLNELYSAFSKPKMKDIAGSPAPLTDLQRVGGAKIFSGAGLMNPMVEEQKRTNDTLIRILDVSKQNLKKNTAATFG